MKSIIFLVVLTTFCAIQNVESQTSNFATNFYCAISCSNPLSFLNPICPLCRLNNNRNSNSASLSESVSSNGAKVDATGTVSIGGKTTSSSASGDSTSTTTNGAASTTVPTTTTIKP